VQLEDAQELGPGREYSDVDLSGTRFRNVNLTGARFAEANLVNARFSGLIHGLVINDVEVAPLISAEMERRYPERAKLLPTTAAGARDAWSVIEALWDATKARARTLPPDLLRERVDGEWSFLESMRHLVMVTDGWIGGTVLGRSGHFWPAGVLPSFLTDPAAFGIDPSADPDLGAVIAAREERIASVRALVDGLRDDDLRRRCGDQSLLECLWTVFDEEWHHNWFANRDLDVLTTI
jgi:DinB superfamily/Pentapeptide repeats (8 copies)